MIAVSTLFAGAFSAWVRKVDWQRNNINNISYMQFTIITMSVSDFSSDLNWGCQVLLAGGKGTLFGFFSVAVTIFVMAYNMRTLYTILYGGNHWWAQCYDKHKNKFPRTYAALFLLATTDMNCSACFRGMNINLDRMDSHIRTLSRLLIKAATWRTSCRSSVKV